MLHNDTAMSAYVAVACRMYRPPWQICVWNMHLASDLPLTTLPQSTESSNNVQKVLRPMSRPPTRGTGDASGLREVQQPNDYEPQSRPTRNAPRIFTDGTILYSTSHRSIAQALEYDDAEATEDIKETISATPRTPTGTTHNPPQRKTRKLPKTNMLQTQESAAAPIVAQLRQGRIDQMKGLPEAVNKIIIAMKKQEELAEKRHSELRAKLQEVRAQNEHLRQELRECKEELQACKDTPTWSQQPTDLRRSSSRKQGLPSAEPSTPRYLE